MTLELDELIAELLKLAYPDQLTKLRHIAEAAYSAGHAAGMKAGKADGYERGYDKGWKDGFYDGKHG